MSFSFLKQISAKRGHKDLMQGQSVSDSDSLSDFCDAYHSSRRTRNEGDSWTIETSAPFDDGFLWRKYGTKKISNSSFPRSYFRCTYKDERNCKATKQVQQKDNTDPPLFNVTYSYSHSCNSKPISNPNPKLCIQNPKTNIISFDFSKFSSFSSGCIDSTPLDSKTYSMANLNKMDVKNSFESGSSSKSEITDCGLDGLDGFEEFDDSVLREYFSSSFDMD